MTGTAEPAEEEVPDALAQIAGLVLEVSPRQRQARSGSEHHPWHNHRDDCRLNQVWQVDDIPRLPSKPAGCQQAFTHVALRLVGGGPAGAGHAASGGVPQRVARRNAHGPRAEHHSAAGQ